MFSLIAKIVIILYVFWYSPAPFAGSQKRLLSRSFSSTSGVESPISEKTEDTSISSNVLKTPSIVDPFVSIRNVTLVLCCPRTWRKKWRLLKIWFSQKSTYDFSVAIAQCVTLPLLLTPCWNHVICFQSLLSIYDRVSNFTTSLHLLCGICHLVPSYLRNCHSVALYLWTTSGWKWSMKRKVSSSDNIATGIILFCEKPMHGISHWWIILLVDNLSFYLHRSLSRCNVVCVEVFFFWNMLSNTSRNDIVLPFSLINTSRNDIVLPFSLILRLRNYANTVTGTEIVDWLVSQNIQQNRAQACLIGQKLLYGEWIKSVSDDMKVKKNSKTDQWPCTYYFLSNWKSCVRWIFSVYIYFWETLNNQFIHYLEFNHMMV